MTALGKAKKRPREYFVLNCREQTAALPSPLSTFCHMFYRAVATTSRHFKDAYWLHLLDPDNKELTTCPFELEGELARAKARAKCHGKDELDYITLNVEEYGPLACGRTPSPFFCALAGEEPKRLASCRQDSSSHLITSTLVTSNLDFHLCHLASGLI